MVRWKESPSPLVWTRKLSVLEPDGLSRRPQSPPLARRKHLLVESQTLPWASSLSHICGGCVLWFSFVRREGDYL